MDDVIDALARDPLRNIVLLKHLEAFPGDTRVHHVRGTAGAATLVLLSAAASAYDRQAYPEVEYSAVISSDHPDLTAGLLPYVPRGVGVVFKLMNDADRDVVGAAYSLRRATSFRSFTAETAFTPDERVRITIRPDEVAFSLFEAQGHARGWLRSLLESGRAFVAVLERDRNVLAACFAFQNYGRVWEVGGVCTPAEFRRQGHARRVVRTALAELGRRGLIPRYQVHERNEASTRLAESIGLKQFLITTHFIHMPEGRDLA
ncbi:GNAT family N-acetyltransferase [Inquilinus sp. NPDC058860]|uniref:GNAT family N-acetyltransferase n=1 Tax=Inquilinus sp. NPDC058860 TaxID=3346652 RepID=UPI0036BE37CE